MLFIVRRSLCRSLGVRRHVPLPHATDVEAARRLWESSERLTGIRYGLPSVPQ